MRRVFCFPVVVEVVCVDEVVEEEVGVGVTAGASVGVGADAGVEDSCEGVGVTDVSAGLVSSSPSVLGEDVLFSFCSSI